MEFSAFKLSEMQINWLKLRKVQKSISRTVHHVALVKNIRTVAEYSNINGLQKLQEG